AGSLCVFLLARKFGQTRFLRFISGNKQIKRVMEWIDRNGFSQIFILLVMPFTPSSAVNIVAGLSKIIVYQFILALVGGKLIKVFAISYIVYD
ncbi:VTT domain-containing protein, partial [Listeria monocytogenes]|nr:VTT domain-containing protein [Listeria monocytogenes]